MEILQLKIKVQTKFEISICTFRWEDGATDLGYPPGTCSSGIQSMRSMKTSG